MTPPFRRSSVAMAVASRCTAVWGVTRSMAILSPSGVLRSACHFRLKVVHGYRSSAWKRNSRVRWPSSWCHRARHSSTLLPFSEAFAIANNALATGSCPAALT
eukprot:CAMPEP_0176307832 /NCGR_PEP_ID=MMETSP0121_2-20121125/64228_1 /TAXON_ID=160619 /ORGANISM="Kryptoperidinium foliaceum, Strain CCMP 1326" /LENGTH=102 /DNA_ID=CAMNT_0017649639 /DNA_START=44 /DNA_END=348 /DNA_ORIENTATION=+